MPYPQRDAAPLLATGSLFAPLPKGYVRIMIARGPMPKGVDLNTMRYQALTPQWSAKDTPPDVFQRQYINKLANLDPEFVFEDIRRMGGARVPVLCGYSTVATIAGGHGGCHRHLAAEWFERALDIRVPEIGASSAFDRLTWWRTHPIVPAAPGERPRTGPAPDYRRTKAARAVRRLGQGSFKF